MGMPQTGLGLYGVELMACCISSVQARESGAISPVSNLMYPTCGRTREPERRDKAKRVCRLYEIWSMSTNILLGDLQELQGNLTSLNRHMVIFCRYAGGLGREKMLIGGLFRVGGGVTCAFGS